MIPNLVGILRALKATDAGAGAVLNAADLDLRKDPSDLTRPIETVARAVPLDWTDYNGHMNEARYLQAFGDATDRFMEIIGCDADYNRVGRAVILPPKPISGISTRCTLEAAFVSTPFVCWARAKSSIFSTRCMKVAGCWPRANTSCCTSALRPGKPSPPGPVVERKLTEIATDHSELPLPEGIGRAVGQRR